MLKQSWIISLLQIVIPLKLLSFLFFVVLVLRLLLLFYFSFVAEYMISFIILHPYCLCQPVTDVFHLSVLQLLLNWFA